MWPRSRNLPEPQVKSASQKNSDAKTYFAVIDHNMPVRVTISDGNGNVLDGYEINTNNSIQYGNEKISTMESGPLEQLSGRQIEPNQLRGHEGQRFVRRKAVLMQLSKVIDEMEERLFFIETKHDIEIFGKGSTTTPHLKRHRPGRLKPSKRATSTVWLGRWTFGPLGRKRSTSPTRRRK